VIARRPRRLRAAAFLLLAAGFLAILAPGIHAAVCEEAFIRCIYDPDVNQFMNFMGSGVIYCGLGYVFCKKYIEPDLG
jgi:hypothetical protein